MSERREEVVRTLKNKLEEWNRRIDELEVQADLMEKEARAEQKRQIEAMRKLVYAFYDMGFSFGKLIRKYSHLRGDLTDCLIGNLEKDFTELFTATADFAKLPEELPYGGPRMTVAREVVSDE